MKGLSCYAWGFGGVSGMASLFSDEMIYGFQDLICSNYSLSTGLKLQTSESQISFYFIQGGGIFQNSELFLIHMMSHN